MAQDTRSLVLLVVARTAALAIAAALLLWEGPRLHDAAALAYAVASTVAIARSAALRRSPAAWAVDSTVVLSLIVLSDDWRSPYYLLWLTTLALPATTLPWRRALWFSGAASLAFVAVALFGGPDPGRLRPASSETLAVHVALPGLLGFTLAYAAAVLRRLQVEQRIREQLAVQNERRRIAWELHDSAKQRVHAAHLLVSAAAPRAPDELALPLERAVAELESAATEMDTSLAELRSPLGGRPLHEALRDRADELSALTPAQLTVHGAAPRLAPLVGAHVYRIACEALANAVRHADADRIDIVLDHRDQHLRLSVDDDGAGIGPVSRSGATGLRSMDSRAATIGATLTIGAGAGGGGTQVTLDIPLDHGGPS